MKKKSTIWSFAILVFALPAIAYALVSWYEKKVEALPVLGKTKEHRIADFNLTNQDKQIVTIAKWDNKIVVANFFFTHCPVVCPKMTTNLKKIHDAYNDKSNVLITSFTVDPERDSAVQLNKYAAQYKIDNSRWILLTGDKKEIYKLARNSFMITATDGDGGTNDFIHSEKLILVDTQKRIRGYYTGTDEKEVNQLINDIKKLMYEN
jgi:protein SCO1